MNKLLYLLPLWLLTVFVAYLYGVGSPAASTTSCVVEPGGVAAHVKRAFANSSATKNNHCYGWMYAAVIAELRSSPPSSTPMLLEIGIDRMNSLTLWKSVFQGRVTVHGVENGKKWGPEKLAAQVVQARAQGIEVHVGDQADASFLAQLVRQTPGGFDLIVDDGGHTTSQQRASLIALWRHVKPGGAYVIEDLESNYYTRKKSGFGCYGLECGGGPVGKSGTTIDMLKSMVDVLNRDFHDGPNPWNTHSLIGYGSYTVLPDDGHLASLRCFRNMCALHKLQGDEFACHSCKTACPARQP